MALPVRALEPERLHSPDRRSNALARKAYQQTDDDASAIALLARWIAKDRELRQAVIEAAARELIYRTKHLTRRRLLSHRLPCQPTLVAPELASPGKPPLPDLKGYPLRNGTRLALADEAMLRLQIETHQTLAATHAWLVRWFEKVLAALLASGRRTVGEAIDNETLVRLQQEAHDEAG